MTTDRYASKPASLGRYRPRPAPDLPAPPVRPAGTILAPNPAPAIPRPVAAPTPSPTPSSNLATVDNALRILRHGPTSYEQLRDGYPLGFDDLVALATLVARSEGHDDVATVIRREVPGEWA